MSIFQLAAVLLCITSVLTSTVNQTVENDRNSPTGLNKLFEPSITETKHSTLLPDTRSVNKKDSDAVSKPETEIPTEGGLVANSPKAETKSSKIPDVSNEDEKLKTTPEMIISGLDQGSKKSGSHARKGVVEEDNKRVGKKGVKYDEELPGKKETATKSEIIPDKKVSDVINTPKEPSGVKTEPILPEIKNTDHKISHNDTNLVKNPDIVSNTTTKSFILVPSHPNDTMTHKRKPTSTTGEGDDDGKGMPSSPTQKDIGLPRKVDYIIPVVITIMATPVLGIAAFILYTRGRDCWDKRHYRRMDFLIDGMYND